MKNEKQLSINDLFDHLKVNQANYLDIYSTKGKERKMFSDIYQDVLKVIHQLKCYNITTGCRIGILGTSCYEYVLIDLACVVTGVLTVPLDLNILYDSSETIETFKLDLLITNINRYSENSAKVKTFLEVCSGNQVVKDFNSWRYKEDEIFTVIFSSGTKGIPKASSVHVKCFADQFTHAIEMYAIDEQDKMLVFLPLHIYLERCYIYLAILKGFNIVVADPNFIIKVLKHDQITFTVGVPFFFESMQNLFLAQVEHNDELRYKYEQFLANKSANRNNDVFIPFKNFWGGSIRFLLTGSAPCKRSVLEFYHNMGVPLYEGYGMSELAGMIALNYPENVRLGSVGKIFPGKKVTLDENGQILVAGEFVVNRGYLNQPEPQNRSVFLEDGWVATGDTGYFDEEGYLYLTGRINDVIVLSNGKKVYPDFIESKFYSADFIKDCVVLGNNKPGLSALIVPKYADIDQFKLQELIRQINSELPKDEKIAHYQVINDPFTAENGMLTSNFKVNRSVINKKYSDLIKCMYA
jgi:long-chain acyl-CoA synthetase